MTTGNAYQVPTLPIPPAITDQESGGSEDEWGGHAPVPAFSSRQSSAPEEHGCEGEPPYCSARRKTAYLNRDSTWCWVVHAQPGRPSLRDLTPLPVVEADVPDSVSALQSLCHDSVYVGVGCQVLGGRFFSRFEGASRLPGCDARSSSERDAELSQRIQRRKVFVDPNLLQPMKSWNANFTEDTGRLRIGDCKTNSDALSRRESIRPSKPTKLSFSIDSLLGDILRD
ncbi:unnamed protein product [Bemisia tabaci]|uniref:Uncharacterized protein n=1 Tax=Bemisia tabaci TaxID=7038 RepID=A0A9P0AED6_BEMTA|nr:unnamed protein product [Bemisia tabaci]